MSETKSVTRNSPKKTLNAIIGYGCNLIVACAVMMWSVFNFSINLMEYRAGAEPDQDWWVTGLIVLVACVLPFFIGLRLLSKTLIPK